MYLLKKKKKNYESITKTLLYNFQYTKKDKKNFFSKKNKMLLLEQTNILFQNANIECLRTFY